MQKADGNGLAVFLYQIFCDGFDRLQIERHDNLSRHVKAFRNLKATVARCDRLRRGRLDVVHERTITATGYQDVAMTCRDQHRDIGSGPFQRRIGRDRRAMTNPHQSLGIDIQAGNTIQDAFRLVFRRRRHLAERNAATCRIIDDQIL